MSQSKLFQIHFRVTKEEYQAISAKAALADLSLSEYLRRCSMQDTDRPIINVDAKTLRLLYRDLRHAGGNLNQIARQLNSKRDIPEDLLESSKDAIKTIASTSACVYEFITLVKRNI